ncbi:MAG TPA: Ku protein [Candidatus Polarisedimenticolaceae bacterium]|nr:Ku protein [Candidatus Polarisedimenticolaceae bacterium]
MSARPMGTAMVSFGMVSIPVKLYATAETGSQIHFNTLHKTCGSRLKQQYICPQEEVVVPREDMVKGYEFAKDQYVRFTDEEIKALQEKATQTIEIAEFVPAAQVDPLYFDTAYFLGPDKGGDKAYSLLAEAMRKTGKAALARYTARGKQYLVLVRPQERGLVMQQLHYADEVRSMGDVPLGNTEVKDAELELAVKLVEQIASERFQPERYEDAVRKRIMEQIQQKVQGQEITAPPAEAPKAQVIDLMQALKASLQAAPASERKPAQRAPRAAAQKTKASR